MLPVLNALQRSPAHSSASRLRFVPCSTLHYTQCAVWVVDFAVWLRNKATPHLRVHSAIFIGRHAYCHNPPTPSLSLSLSLPRSRFLLPPALHLPLPLHPSYCSLPPLSPHLLISSLRGADSAQVSGRQRPHWFAPSRPHCPDGPPGPVSAPPSSLLPPPSSCASFGMHTE